MSNLFELTAELQHIQQLMLSADGDELPQELVDWLDVTQEGFDRKVEGYCSVIGELEAVMEARRKEAVRLDALADLARNKADRMKVALKEAMLKLETPKLETLKYKVWVQAAGGKQPIQIEESDVPDEFKKTQLVTDKDAIRCALEDGKQLPFAQLLPRGMTLRIK